MPTAKHRVTIVLEDDLYEKVSGLAKQEGRTASNLVAHRLRKALMGGVAPPPPPTPKRAPGPRRSAGEGAESAEEKRQRDATYAEALKLMGG